MSTLSFSPASWTLGVGDTLDTWIMLDGPDTINAAQVNISWPVSLLTLLGIDYTQSAMTVQAEHFIGSGVARMARAIQGGTSPISGLQVFARLTFRAEVAGVGTIHFDDSSAVIHATTFQNVLTLRTDGVYTIQDVDVPPSPPILGGNMPVIQVGAQLQVTGSEPNTNADGTVLSDLSKTVVSYDLGQGPVVGSEIPATSANGGGSFDTIFSIPVQGQQANVAVWANAVDLTGNVSANSQTVNLSIDLLAPAPPVI